MWNNNKNKLEINFESSQKEVNCEHCTNNSLHHLSLGVLTNNNMLFFFLLWKNSIVFKAQTQIIHIQPI